MAGTVSIKFSAKDNFTRITERLNKALRKNKASFGKLDTAMEKSARKAKKTSGAMSKSFGKIGKALAGVAGVAAAIKVAKAGFGNVLTLEQGKNRVLQNVSGRQNRADISDKIEAAIIKGSAISGKSREEVSEGLFAQLSAQGTGDQAFTNFFKNLELATGFTADLGATIAGVSKIQENFADAKGDIDTTLAALAAGQTFGQTDVQQLVDALPGLSVDAATAGLTSVDTISGLASLSKKLGGTAQAATGLSSFLGTITRAKINTPAGGALAGLGIPVGAKALQESGLTLTDILRLANKGAKENEFLFNEAFGDQGSVQVARAATPELFENMRKIQEQTARDMSDLGEGAVALNFETATTGLSGTMIDNKAALDKVNDQIGLNLIPALEAQTEAVHIANLRSEVQGGGLLGTSEVSGTLGNQAGALIETIVATVFGKTEELKAFRAEEAGRLRIELDARGLSTVTTGSTGDQTVTD